MAIGFFYRLLCCKYIYPTHVCRKQRSSRFTIIQGTARGKVDFIVGGKSDASLRLSCRWCSFERVSTLLACFGNNLNPINISFNDPVSIRLISKSPTVPIRQTTDLPGKWVRMNRQFVTRQITNMMIQKHWRHFVFSFQQLVSLFQAPNTIRIFRESHALSVYIMGCFCKYSHLQLRNRLFMVSKRARFASLASLYCIF